MRNRSTGRVWLTITLGGMLLLCGCGRRSGRDAGDADTAPKTGSVAPQDWRAERDLIRERATKTAVERAWQEVSPEAIATANGLAWPLPPTTQSPAAVDRAVEEMVAARVEAKFPAADEGAVREECAAKYPRIEIGAAVNFVIRGGRGSSANVKGIYAESSATHIRVDSRWVLKDDLPEAIVFRIDPKARERQIEKDFRAKRFMLQHDRDVLAGTVTEAISRELYTEAGYVKVDDTWVPGTGRLEQLVQREVENQARRLRPAIEAERFKEAGFALKDGEYQPSAMKGAKRLFR